MKMKAALAAVMVVPTLLAGSLAYSDPFALDAVARTEVPTVAFDMDSRLLGVDRGTPMTLDTGPCGMLLLIR